MVRSGKGSWSQVKQRAREMMCLAPDTNCDCVQQKAIIYGMLEAMAVAHAVLVLVIPALATLTKIKSRVLLMMIRTLLGRQAAATLENMVDIVKQLEDMQNVQDPFLDLTFNESTGMWENVPTGIDPIVIK